MQHSARRDLGNNPRLVCHHAMSAAARHVNTSIALCSVSGKAQLSKQDGKLPDQVIIWKVSVESRSLR